MDPFGLKCKEITLEDIKFRSMWGGEGIEFYVRGDDGEKLNLGLAEVAEDKSSISFGIFNNDNDGVTLKPVGFSLTEAVLAVSILEVMRQTNGVPPENLPGSLASANRFNYQKEYALAIADGLNEDQARGRAIKNISFGKHRVNMGYSNIEIAHGAPTTIMYDAKGNLLEMPLENVPSGVGVKKAELADQEKLYQVLSKYEEVYESGRE